MFTSVFWQLSQAFEWKFISNYIRSHRLTKRSQSYSHPDGFNSSLVFLFFQSFYSEFWNSAKSFDNLRHGSFLHGPFISICSFFLGSYIYQSFFFSYTLILWGNSKSGSYWLTFFFFFTLTRSCHLTWVGWTVLIRNIWSYFFLMNSSLKKYFSLERENIFICLNPGCWHNLTLQNFYICDISWLTLSYIVNPFLTWLSIPSLYLPCVHLIFPVSTLCSIFYDWFYELLPKRQL